MLLMLSNITVFTVHLARKNLYTVPFAIFNKPHLQQPIQRTRRCRIVMERADEERHSTSNKPFQMANPSHFNVNAAERNNHLPPAQSPSITAKSTATESYFPIVCTNTANPCVAYVGVELLGALSNLQCILGKCTDNDIRNGGVDVANQFDACNPDNTDHHTVEKTGKTTQV